MKQTLLMLACALAAFGQAVRVDPNPVLTTAGNTPFGAYAPVLAVPSATISLCSDPACSTAASGYTSLTGGTACPINAPVVLAGSATCQATSNQQGNFGFFLLAGQYYYQIRFPNGSTYGPYPLTVGSSGGGGGGGANTALSNLASTAVNVGISPATNNSISLGDATHHWASLWAENVLSFASASLIIGTEVSQPLVFYTNATNRMSISGAGALTIASVGGAGVQCLHVDNGGVVTGTGADCGSGGGGGANTTLSNLGATAVNASITLATNKAFSLGDATHAWLHVYSDSLISATGAAMTVGPTDAQAVNIQSNGVTRLSYSSAGAMTIAGFAGHGVTCLQSDNSGVITNATLGCDAGANAALSNLSAVAINTALLAGSGGLNIGATGTPFADEFFNQTYANTFRISRPTTSFGESWQLRGAAGNTNYIELVNTASTVIQSWACASLPCGAVMNANFIPGAANLSLGRTGNPWGTTVTDFLTIDTIIGSTQCLQVNTLGVVSGTGSGCSGAGGANTDLSNLSATTAVNANLKPAGTNAISLGSNANEWSAVYAVQLTSNVAATPMEIGPVNNVALEFFTNNTERLRIFGSGDVQVNNATDQGSIFGVFDNSSNAAFRVNQNGAGSAIYASSTAGGAIFAVGGTGYYGIYAIGPDGGWFAHTGTLGSFNWDIVIGSDNTRGFGIGTGSPQSVVTAAPGSWYMNASGGAGATLWVKESGTGNTGWVAK